MADSKQIQNFWEYYFWIQGILLVLKLIGVSKASWTFIWSPTILLVVVYVVVIIFWIITMNLGNKKK